MFVENLISCVCNTYIKDGIKKKVKFYLDFFNFVN